LFTALYLYLFADMIEMYVHCIVMYQPNKSSEDPSTLLQQMVPESYLKLNQDVLSKAAEIRKSKTAPILTLTEFW